MDSTQHFDQFFRLFAVGVGLFFLGGVNLLLRNSRGWVRALGNAAVLALVLGGFLSWSGPGWEVGQVAVMVGLATLPVVLVGSRRLVAFATLCMRVAQRPAVRWGVLCGLGVGTIAVAAVRFTHDDERAQDAQMNELEILVSSPPLSVRENVVAQTDRGTAIVVRAPQSERSQADIDIPESRLLRERGYEENIFRRAAATDQSNCHGWVFTGGQYWLNGESVEQILADNNYTEVTDPRPGDVVIYRNERGISHTGIVRYVAKGQIPLVESKWAWMGVFLHPVDKSPYDKDYTFYRSPRNGHVVAGIPQPTVQAAPADITD